MPTLDETRGMAADAALDAARRLEGRGVDPDRCPRLLEAVQHGTERVIVALGAGSRDANDYRRFLDEVYERLDADPIVDEPPRPPRRQLNPRLLDRDWQPGPRI